MNYEFDSSLTGNVMIDSLQGVQKVANGIESVEEKITYVRRATRLIAAYKLLEHPFLVTSGLALAREADGDPHDRVLFDKGLLFIGSLVEFGYIIEDSIPIDSLMLTFEKPEVIDVSIDHAPLFQKLTLQIPVLAIESCISADAA